MIAAELLKDFDEKRFRPGFVSVKRDGIHGIIDPAFSAPYSRTPREFKGIQHLKQAAAAIQFPLVAELLIPGLPFEESSGKLRSFNECPDAVAYVFNIATPGFFNNRLALMQDLARKYETEYLKFETYYAVKTLKDLDNYYTSFLDAGHEGLVWIAPDHIYQPGKRTYNWMKKVPMKSIEAEIIDIQEGNKGGKFEGTLGRMVCVMDNDKQFNVGIFKGFDNAWRDKIWTNRFDYIGEKCTVEFKEYTKYGKPRQPRFKGFRWDL